MLCVCDAMYTQFLFLYNFNLISFVWCMDCEQREEGSTRKKRNLLEETQFHGQNLNDDFFSGLQFSIPITLLCAKICIFCMEMLLVKFSGCLKV